MRHAGGERERALALGNPAPFSPLARRAAATRSVDRETQAQKKREVAILQQEALAATSAGDFAKALAILTQAMELCAKPPALAVPLRLELSRCSIFSELGRHDEAMCATAACAERRPRLAIVHQCRGQVALCAAKHASKMQWWVDALSSLLTARELDASDEKTHGLLKDCLAAAPPGTAALSKRQQEVTKLVAAFDELSASSDGLGSDAAQQTRVLTGRR